MLFVHNKRGAGKKKSQNIKKTKTKKLYQSRRIISVTTCVFCTYRLKIREKNIKRKKMLKSVKKLYQKKIKKKTE